MSEAAKEMTLDEQIANFIIHIRRKEMIPWIYADLDTIIDSYSEPPKEE